MRKGTIVESLVALAKDLHRNIKAEQRTIDNPALVMGILSELEFFIENAAGEGDDEDV